MQQLIIDRSKWRTGGSVLNKDLKYGNTRLLNRQGMMCCLGFYCEQIENVPKEHLLEIPLPEDVDILNSTSVLIREIDKMSNGKTCINTEFTDDAIDINDEGDLSSEEREKAIIKHFNGINVEVIFKNDYI